MHRCGQQKGPCRSTGPRSKPDRFLAGALAGQIHGVFIDPDPAFLLVLVLQVRQEHGKHLFALLSQHLLACLLKIRLDFRRIRKLLLGNLSHHAAAARGGRSDAAGARNLGQSAEPARAKPRRPGGDFRPRLGGRLPPTNTRCATTRPRANSSSKIVRSATRWSNRSRAT